LQFQDLLDRYGDAVEAWPLVEREAATSLLAASPDARSRHARSRAFTSLFDPGEVPPAPSADRIVARIVARPSRGWSWLVRRQPRGTPASRARNPG
jgi:hypothetical protein